MVSGDYGIDDLPFAARPSQRGPLQQVLLNRTLVIFGRLVFLESPSQLVCLIEDPTLVCRMGRSWGFTWSEGRSMMEGGRQHEP
ncbi:MAG TPA: hypothetical protein VLG28_13075 [Acidimicrobiia bacterium]|jgi:hypothetical protein|nr:hypothetical protein [Acidimicrobiia bacterium]